MNRDAFHEDADDAGMAPENRRVVERYRALPGFLAVENSTATPLIRRKERRAELPKIVFNSSRNEIEFT